FCVCDFGYHTAPKMNDLAESGHRVRQIQTGANTRVRKHGAVFNHSAAIDLRMMFNRCATRYYGAVTNQRGSADERRSKNTRALFYARTGSNPNAGTNFLACGRRLGLQRENVDGELANVARVHERIDVALMDEVFTLAAASPQAAAEQRSGV